MQSAEELNKELANINRDLIVAMQAAYIEFKHGNGAVMAMLWIENTLCGPGLIPNSEDPYGKEAQAFYDANNSNPLPYCFCERPSNIIWMGQGFCSNAHFEQAKASQESPKSAENLNRSSGGADA